CDWCRESATPEEVVDRRQLQPESKLSWQVEFITDASCASRRIKQSMPKQLPSDLITAGVALKKTSKAKDAGGQKTKKLRKGKAPPRLRARWGVFDAGMKQVAIFDYSQRAAADEKLADLLAQKKGCHFLQVVKEPMPEQPPSG